MARGRAGPPASVADAQFTPITPIQFREGGPILDTAGARKRLERARRMAERRRSEVETTAGFDRPESDWSGELSSYDNHTADSGSAVEMRSTNLGLINHNESRLGEIDEALARLDEGTYGTCVVCGREIPKARLEAVPWAASCVECGAKRPSTDNDATRRPIEEQVIRPPFGGRDSAHAYDDPGIHGEDIWDELAEYGTANTGQDDEAANAGGIDDW
jgi:DnaK suppressor protein